MKTYIGTKIIQAEPMTLEDFNSTYNKVIPATEGSEGYLVVYPDGYKSWSPKQVFEAAYMTINQSDKITPQDVESFFELKETIKMGEKTTVCRFKCKNGFEIIESSSCVDPDNYDEVMGVSICRKRAEDKVWLILGSLLQFGKGLN